MKNEAIHGFQVSPQQKHLWLLQKATDGFPYRSLCTVEITGNLNVDFLKNTLKSVVEQHQILRTSFRCLAGLNTPLQVIENGDNLLIQQQDFRKITPEEQKEAVLLLKSAKLQNFDFEQSFLLQVSLVILSEFKYILLLNLPSFYADAASLKNLVAEISYAYSANFHPDIIKNEKLQYIFFSEWQNELLEAKEAEIGTEYWQQKDIAHIFNLKLPNENIYSGEGKFKPQVFINTISTQLKSQIDTFAQKFNTSQTALLLACWQMLLWRLTGVSDMVVGTICDGRTEEELQKILGLFAKYVPVCCHLEGRLQFHQVLEQIALAQNEAYEWQDYFTWEQILGADKVVNNVPFFPFCFDFEKQYYNVLANDKVTFSISEEYVCFDKFNVKLSFILKENSLKAEWHYNSNLFLQKDIECLAKQFLTLLESAINNPYTSLSQLQILNGDEKEQLLAEFNNTKTNFPKNKCLHQLFEEQLERTPDNIAVVYKNQQLTYHELNTRANQLAHYLQQLGVRPDIMVGICVERSPLMVIALLAILKAGGAYVPVDPNYPLERKAFILNDSQMPVLLTQEHLMANLPENEIKIICIDRDLPLVNQQQTENPVTKISELNLAYVIYTSGSTGKPKGTLIPHQGLVNYLSWCTQAYAVEQGVGTLVHSPLGFDLTITSLLSPLLVGCAVELLPEEQGIEALSQALSKSSNLSLVKITPAHLELLKQQLSKENIANKTKAFIIGGENLLAENITFWQDVAPDTILVNEYGPTETVVGCCVYQVPVGKGSSGSIPIGKPIANTQLYVLDKYLQPVPIGVPGELHIAGIGLARGYLNQAELTALKFIPNPFSNNEGDRLYKTGDLVRHLPTGDIEYIGRIDNQVKIRGFRVELGEIEAAINNHPSVSASVVIIREDKPGKQTLVAYVTLHPEQTLTIPELRSFLQNKLLDHMIPTAFMILEGLPLTSNGKVDRQALPIPNNLRPELEAAYVVPQTEVEKTIASIWQKALNIEKIGIHDNFFEIGGHSLLLVTVHSQLQVIFKTELSTLDLFRYPTISSLAGYLSSSPNQTTSLQEADIQTEKILDGKAQQRKRLQKMKSVESK
ncbi:MAG: amino acid adenylation domain-containing protein [Scytonematopsis contorta HA4267-MV1]|jgi:amino acid adenylation domain-containing protein|nr:amino acid adenylation domain-containing protein [Scytonematopsis contorta HA4267-MV1]